MNMLAPGDTFERYTVEELLGRGGMGEVYRARDTKLGRNVALKVISHATPSPESRTRLLREARAAAALDHPNAVSIFDVGEHDGAPFIVMELVDGQTLRATVGDASIPRAQRIAELADVARGLASAHRRGLVHRDVKPENVMVRSDGVVKVLDFGIARRASGVDPLAATASPALPTLTIAGTALGTPVYMAPEQIRGLALDGRADQFSWGVLAYELFTGRVPWRGATDALSVVASVLTDPVDHAPLDAAGLPPAVQEVLARALEKRPEDRFATMDDLLRALEAASTGAAAPESPKRARVSAPPPGATEAQRFSTIEVKEVLGKAVERQAAKQASAGKLGFEDLLAVAAEVGVDPDSLREASRALRAPGPAPSPPAPPAPPAGAAAAWLKNQRRDLYRHAGVYAIVNGGLLALGLVLLGAFTPWWVWFIPALAWGVGLAIHALVAFTSNEDDWREHDDAMQAWQRRRDQRHEQRMAALGWLGGLAGNPAKRVAAAARPADAAARGRARVHVTPPPATPGAPPTTDTAEMERERAAEDEANVSDPGEARRRR
jgi:serine/threonine-protein kinase